MPGHHPEKPAHGNARGCMAGVALKPSLTTSGASSSLRIRGRNMADSVLLFVGGVAVAVNVAVLWLMLRMANRSTWEFDNTR